MNYKTLKELKLIVTCLCINWAVFCDNLVQFKPEMRHDIIVQFKNLLTLKPQGWEDKVENLIKSIV